MTVPIHINSGALVRHARTSGFKLAVVVAAASPGPRSGERRLRVRFWRAASGRWTNPVAREVNSFELITPDEARKHRALIRAAQVAAFTEDIVCDDEPWAVAPPCACVSPGDAA